MRIAVTGASGVIGRGLVARLLSQGHDVVGLARHRPESWPSAADFVESDIRDVAGVRRAVAGADVVVHCAWAVDPAALTRIVARSISAGPPMCLTRWLRAVPGASCSPRRRMSTAQTKAARPPLSEADAEPGIRRRARQSPCRRDAGRVRCGMGRDPLGAHPRPRRRQLGAPSVGFPAFSDTDAGRRLQVVHSDDVHRVFVQATVDTGIGSGPVNLAAQGESTLRQIAGVLGRPDGAGG